MPRDPSLRGVFGIVGAVIGRVGRIGYIDIRYGNLKEDLEAIQTQLAGADETMRGLRQEIGRLQGVEQTVSELRLEVGGLETEILSLRQQVRERG